MKKLKELGFKTNKITVVDGIEGAYKCIQKIDEVRKTSILQRMGL